MLNPLSSIQTDPLNLLTLYRTDVAAGTHCASQDEVHALLAQIATAITTRDHAREHACKQRLIETHLGLVIAMATERCRFLRRLDLLDLIQEGNIGLLHAARDYPYGRDDGGFTAYACACIGHAMTIGLHADHLIMVTPIVFHQQRKRDATFSERLRQMQPLSLDRPLLDAKGETHALADRLGATVPTHPETETTTTQKHALVEQLLAVLPPRQQQVMRLYYGLDPEVVCEPTRSSVARFLGVKSINFPMYQARRKLRAVGITSPQEEAQQASEQGGKRA